MVRNPQFMLNYNGTKYQETQYIDSINLTQYDTIIEAFGGSFGYLRYLWIHKNSYIVAKKLVVYDNNEDLIDFYNYVKKLINENKFNAFIDEYNNYNTTIFKGNRQANTKETKTFIDSIDDKYMRFILKQNIFTATGMCRAIFKKNVVFLDLITKITFICKSFEQVDFTEYDPNKTLIYLDPPYLLECNTFYKNVNESVEFYDKIINLFKTNKCLLIHVFGLLHYIFKDYQFMTYDKIYRNKYKDKKHVVYYSGV